MRKRSAISALGLMAAALAVGFDRRAAGDAAAQTWPPFVLVAGLLAVGLVANSDGLFEWAAGLLARLPGGDTVLYAASMLLVAMVTVFLNLDTSVAFLTPVLIHVARTRGAGRTRLLYGCVFMSNSASLLLPGSNLTNLLVLSHQHLNGAVFAARMLPAWIAAVVVTMVVVGLVVRDRDDGARELRDRGGTRPGWLGSVGAGLAVLLVVGLDDPAIPVLLLGIVLLGVAFARGSVRPAEAWETIDPVSLAAVFAVAIGLGTLARRWVVPGELMARSGVLLTVAAAAGAAVLVNNLPAAVLLSTPIPPHPRSLLLGLDLGPNLAMTGSLSALIWYRAARAVGERPSPARYTAIGAVLVPLTLLATLGAEALAGTAGL